MSLKQKIAIIGGGVSGVSCAVMLSREGHQVTVIEENTIGHGCSWGNGAQYNAGSSFPMAYPGVAIQAMHWLTKPNGPVRLAPRELSKSLPWLVKFIMTGRPKKWAATYSAINALNKHCAPLYREMLGEVEFQRIFRPNGALHVWRNPSLTEQDLVVDALRTEHGVSFKRIDASELRDLEPNLSQQYVRGIYFPDSGHVNSSVGLVEALLSRALAYDTNVMKAKALAVDPKSNGVTIRTNVGSHDFDKVIVAAGIRSRDLARKLGITLSIASERGYHITIPGLAAEISRPVTDAASAFVATPLSEGLRVVGIAEFDSPDAPLDPSQAKKLHACAKVILPDISTENATEWMGIRPSTPDSLPIIGSHGSNPRILYATGHGHMGISGAPMTAAIVADLIAGRKARLNVEHFRVR